MARLSYTGMSRHSSAALAPVPEGRASTATSQPAAPLQNTTASGPDPGPCCAGEQFSCPRGTSRPADTATNLLQRAVVIDMQRTSGVRLSRWGCIQLCTT